MTLSLALTLLLATSSGLILGALAAYYRPLPPDPQHLDRGLAVLTVLAAGLLLSGVPVFWSFLVLLVVSVTIGWGLGRRHPQNPAFPTNTPFQSYEFSLILLILVAAFLLRFLKIGDFGFRIDEIRHFRAAVGYLNTGEYSLWSFQSGVLHHPYDRAWMYTWQVAQAFQSFGVDLSTGRLVSLAWGIMMFLPVYLLVRELDVPLYGRLIVLLWLALSPLAISISRWLRMYSMFITVFLLTVWLLLRLIKARSRGSKLFYGVLATVSWAVSLHLHQLGIGILPALVVYLFWEHRSTVTSWIRNQTPRNPLRLSAGVGIAGLVLLVGWLSIPVGIGNLLGEINVDTRLFWVYIPYLLGGSVPYGLGGILIGGVLVNFVVGSREQRFLVLQILVSLLVLIVFTDRFPQMRYVSHLSILSIPVFVSGLTEVVRHWDKTVHGATLLLLGCGLVVSFTSAYPSVRKGHMGYLGFPGQISPQYTDAIRYIRRGSQPGDIILGYNLPEYYARVLSKPGIRVDWIPRSLRPFEDLPEINPGTLRVMEQRYDRVWFLTLGKFNGLDEEIRRYLDERYEKILDEKKTMILLYRHPAISDPGRRKSNR